MLELLRQNYFIFPLNKPINAPMMAVIITVMPTSIAATCKVKLECMAKLKKLKKCVLN